MGPGRQLAPLCWAGTGKAAQCMLLLSLGVSLQPERQSRLVTGASAALEATDLWKFKISTVPPAWPGDSALI